VPFKANAARRHRIPRQRHRVTNWAEYDAALRGRGSLTVWFSQEAIAAWKAEPRTTPGGQPSYSALAITTALTLRAVFRLALRQTEGLIGSILRLLGLELAVPDHTTLCGRPRSANRFRLHLSAVRRKPSKPKVCPRRSRALARSCVGRSPICAGHPDRSSKQPRLRQASPVGVAERSGQVRPYVRPVARPMPLAIMGVRSRARHQSEPRARGAGSCAVSPGLPRPQPSPSRRSALPAGSAGLASVAFRAPEHHAVASAAAAARPFAR
jgi:hypothetical protein